YGFTFLSSVLAALGERGASSFVVVAFFGALPLSVALSATYQTPPDAPASYRWSVGHRFWFVLMAVIAFFFAVAAWADPCVYLCGASPGGLFIFAFGHTVLSVYVVWLLVQEARAPRTMQNAIFALVAAATLLIRLSSTVASTLTVVAHHGWPSDFQREIGDATMICLALVSALLFWTIHKTLLLAGRIRTSMGILAATLLASFIGSVDAGIGLGIPDSIATSAFFAFLAGIPIAFGLAIRKALSSPAGTHGSSAAHPTSPATTTTE